MEQIGKENFSLLVSKAFLRLLPIQIIEILVYSINTFVDSLITSQYIGTDAMAAIGFFAPIGMLLGVMDVVVFGSHILCGRLIGSGEGKRVVTLFSTGVVFLSIVSLSITAAFLLSRQSLAVLLGAEGYIVNMLADYIAGFAPGIIFMILVRMLMIFLPFNNDIKRCYLGIGVMIVSNTVLDILFVAYGNLGIFGMGIATSASYLLSFLVMLPGFTSKSKAVFLQFKELSFSDLPEAMHLGLASLMMVSGGAIRGYIMNRMLMVNIGTAAVAAMTVQSTVCAIIGSIPMGSANAFATMGSIYYGEEDKNSFEKLLRFALFFCTLISVTVTALLMLASGNLSSIFFIQYDAAWNVTRRMFLLFPCFLIFNTISGLLLKTYQLQKKTLLVNVISVTEPLVMAVFAVVMIGLIGSDACWLSFPAAEVLSLLAIALSVIVFAKKLPSSTADWMKLDSDFSAEPDQFMEFYLHSMEDVLQISVKVIDFCRKRQVEERKCNVAGLAVEEMAGNVVTHGFSERQKHYVYVRIIAKKRLVICIRDDCKAFNPKLRLEQFTPQDITKNVGIRMIASMAEEMNYQCTGGINSLLIRV